MKYMHRIYYSRNYFDADQICSVSSFTSTVAPTSVTCSDNLPILTNGGITYGGGSTNNRPVGATAEYSCFGNYTLVGVSVRTCGSDGEWSSTTAPVCQCKE